MNHLSFELVTNQETESSASRSEDRSAHGTTSRYPGLRFILALSLVLLCHPHAVHATNDHVNQVRQLIAEGENGPALAAIQEYLPPSGRHPELLFLKGIVHENMGNRIAAIKIYQGLIRDYPDNPAPYNNLAVLHAYNGDFKAATSVLKRALGTNDDYQVIYNNLISIYEKLASDAYRKALDSDDDPLPLLLTHIEEMESETAITEDDLLQMAGQPQRGTSGESGSGLTTLKEAPVPIRGVVGPKYPRRPPGASHQKNM